MSNIGVLLAMRGVQEEKFLQHISSSGRMEVTRRCADAAEVLAAALAGIGDLAVVDVQLGVNRSLVERLKESGVIPVLVAALDDAGSYSSLGVRVIHHGSEDLIEQLLEALATHQPPQREDEEVSQRPGQVISVLSAWGGPGRTTLAVNLAAEFAIRGGNPLLVDADLWGASIKQYLGLDPEGSGIAAAMRGIERGTLDVEGLTRITEERYGIRVLGGLNKSDRWPEVSTPAVNNFWELLRQWPGQIVVDAPVLIPGGPGLDMGSFGPSRNAMLGALLEITDRSCVIASADTVGIHRFINFHLDGHVPGAEVVINRVRGAAAGPGARQSLEELLARFAGIDHAVFIPEDSAVDRAVLESAPVREIAPRSASAGAFAMVADRFLPSRTRRRGRLRVRGSAKNRAH